MAADQQLIAKLKDLFQQNPGLKDLIFQKAEEEAPIKKTISEFFQREREIGEKRLKRLGITGPAEAQPYPKIVYFAFYNDAGQRVLSNRQVETVEEHEALSDVFETPDEAIKFADEQQALELAEKAGEAEVEAVAAEGKKAAPGKKAK